MNAAQQAARPATDQPLVFHVGGDELVGMLSAPEGTADGTALLVVVGGPQVRVGSHRQFVQLTRAVAAAGHVALRFDVRGMGDSSGQPAGFEQLDDDIDAAIAAMIRQRPEVRRVVLWGLCDGASASLLYLQRRHDPRVAGLVLLNPWVRSPQTLARARVRHYYLRRLMQPAFWRKLFSGRLRGEALRDGLHNLLEARAHPTFADSDNGEPTPFPQRMAMGWRMFAGPILLVLSGDDVTAQEFSVHAASDPEWRGALDSPRVQLAELPAADHTFSVPGSSERVAELTLAWMGQLASGRPTAS